MGKHVFTGAFVWYLKRKVLFVPIPLSRTEGPKLKELFYQSFFTWSNKVHKHSHVIGTMSSTWDFMLPLTTSRHVEKWLPNHVVYYFCPFLFLLFHFIAFGIWTPYFNGVVYKKTREVKMIYDESSTSFYLDFIFVLKSFI